MHSGVSFLVMIIFQQWKVGNPNEIKGVFVDQIQAPGQLESELSQNLLDDI